MARTKKLRYEEHEKKGLSQARNLSTDRMIIKIKEHASVTGHKVGIFSSIKRTLPFFYKTVKFWVEVETS